MQQPPPMKLLDWIDKNILDWSMLSRNPNSIELLKKNPYKINWVHLSGNYNAVELLHLFTFQTPIIY